VPDSEILPAFSYSQISVESLAQRKPLVGLPKSIFELFLLSLLGANEKPQEEGKK
jgi:hypothetical protein